jgi:ankyrin repeat protein
MGNDHVVNVLLSKGANVNAVNGFGNTPLHEAASADSFTVVQLLLDAGEA